MVFYFFYIVGWGGSCGGFYKFIFYFDYVVRWGRDCDVYYRIMFVEKRIFFLWVLCYVYKVLKVKSGWIIKLYFFYII